MKTLKDYLEETIRRYGAVGSNRGMGYTLESSGEQVDMKGKKCTACKKGTYEETSQHDDMDGVLHCDKCRKEVKRHQSAKPKEKDVDENAASDDPLLAKAVDLAPVSALEESAELRLILQRAKLTE